jgi:hypothetical protein
MVLALHMLVVEEELVFLLEVALDLVELVVVEMQLLVDLL